MVYSHCTGMGLGMGQRLGMGSMGSHILLVPIHPFRLCTDEYFYSPLHKRWETFVVLEQPPSCSDLTCHPGHHTDQIATLSNIVFYFSCLLLSVVTSNTKAAKNICWALDSQLIYATYVCCITNLDDRSAF